jgi:hypothetical protein
MQQHRIGRRQFLYLSMAGVTLALNPRVFGKSAAADSTDLLSGDIADWQVQDYHNSLGFTAVRLANQTLTIDAHLIGGDPNYSQGEVLLDLQYFSGLEDKLAGVDLSRSTITVTVEVPQELVGSGLNGLQIFSKDVTYTGQYGDWVNVTTGGAIVLKYSPKTGEGPGGTASETYDPARVRVIGLKAGIGSTSADRFDGRLSVTQVEIDPALPITQPPALPSSTPAPHLTAEDKIKVRRDGFYLNNARWFMVGANYRVLDYALPWGTSLWFPSGNGVSKHPNFIRSNLDYMRRAGIKVVRVGLLEDGRVMFDQDGHVVGYDDTFVRDVTLFLDLVHEAGLKAEFTLFDFHIAGKGELLNGVWLRGRSNLLTQKSLRKTFKKKFLVPFLRQTAAHPALLGIDVFNEMEWLISKEEGGGWDDVSDASKAETPLRKSAVTSFVNYCIGVIRDTAPGKLITVGVSSHFVELVKDFDTDYTALHHYPWMGALQPYLPLLPPGKPWSLEEYPTRTEQEDAESQLPGSLSGWLDLALSAGGGAMLWNITPEIDKHTFQFTERESILIELRNWVDRHLPTNS